MTDTQIAENLNIKLRTLANWKKERPKLYNRLKWSYKAEQLLEDIELQSNSIEAKVNELLKDR